jgi:hypothetical protein
LRGAPQFCPASAPGLFALKIPEKLARKKLAEKELTYLENRLD